ncbi:autotransporter outer membrane beta-barrel domain-containing protein [Parasphingorhabdus sp.]|uniref:autotransporter outer membrane beta-barrel domain-containing protein n=1 Tax=Parasphingorhabdus sp. TaxID=2709688 RepID=UPI003BB0E9B8
MQKKITILLAMNMLTAPALASENESENQWRVGISGGATLVGDVDDQTYASASITRNIGDGYVQLSGTLVDAGDAQGLIFAVPASSQQVRLSGGIGLDEVGLDAYISIGRRKFDDELIGNDGNRVIVNSNGNIFGIGGSVTYDLAVGEDGFLSPSIAVDYNSVDIGRVVVLPSGRQATVEEKEEGVSGTLSLTYTHLFGNDANHGVSPYVALVASSNSTAFSPGSNAGGSRMAQLVAIRNQPGQGDVWAELGASASFAITDQLRLSLFATQSIGFVGPEATSLGAGISLGF